MTPKASKPFLKKRFFVYISVNVTTTEKLMVNKINLFLILNKKVLTIFRKNASQVKKIPYPLVYLSKLWSLREKVMYKIIVLLIFDKKG